MLTIDLDDLLRHAEKQSVPGILAAARAAGVLWQCRKESCRHDNPRGRELCSECGHDQKGAPLHDIRPGLYRGPEEDWLDLRQVVTGHFADQEPRPDAVTFLWAGSDDEACWSESAVTVHYGGHIKESPASLDDPAVCEALQVLTDFEAPMYMGKMRVALPARPSAVTSGV
ncbi:hypothetical protein [Streptomyces nanshensis]|uniref:RanBP2-type domain-containing protein n=1 Tax=Streptomyces nanshensis TaxID=518642 RepID=A0A1E7KZI3_9ACTN|nr:hypothetical protein [Streptomyces nanshensis]OEV09325.1 hypothetical protein AN218_23135 [Streptomyces nanshensis]